MTFKPIAAGLVLLTVAACGPRTVEVTPEPPPPPTAANYYGEYTVILPGAGEAAPGSEMIGTWDATGFTVTQAGNVLIQTGMDLTSDGKTLLLWDESSTDPVCAGEGLYSYQDDGTAITIAVISDDCEGRRQSASGARIVRRN